MQAARSGPRERIRRCPRLLLKGVGVSVWCTTCSGEGEVQMFDFCGAIHGILKNERSEPPMHISTT